MADKLTLGRPGVDGELVVRGSDSAGPEVVVRPDGVDLGDGTLRTRLLTVNDAFAFGPVQIGSHGELSVGGAETGFVMQSDGQSLSMLGKRVRVDANEPRIRLKGEDSRITIEELENEVQASLDINGLSLGRSDQATQGQLTATKMHLTLEGKVDAHPVPKLYSVVLKPDAALAWPDEDGIEVPTKVDLLAVVKSLLVKVAELEERLAALEP